MLQELARRCDTLIRLVEKENEENEAAEREERKKSSGRKSGERLLSLHSPCGDQGAGQAPVLLLLCIAAVHCCMMRMRDVECVRPDGGRRRSGCARGHNRGLRRGCHRRPSAQAPRVRSSRRPRHQEAVGNCIRSRHTHAPPWRRRMSSRCAQQQVRHLQRK
jgi:hypothetical protein